MPSSSVAWASASTRIRTRASLRLITLPDPWEQDPKLASSPSPRVESYRAIKVPRTAFDLDAMAAHQGLVEPPGSRRLERTVHHLLVRPLSALTMRLDTLTGSKSASVKLVRHWRSVSFQRASGVPMRPPLSPLSARMIP
jgi:hypothetical protein